MASQIKMIFSQCGWVKRCCLLLTLGSHSFQYGCRGISYIIPNPSRESMVSGEWRGGGGSRLLSWPESTAKPDLNMGLEDGCQCCVILTVTGFLLHLFSNCFFSLLLPFLIPCFVLRPRTRGKLWRRPKPIPPSPWPAWPTRSMP